MLVKELKYERWVTLDFTNEVKRTVRIKLRKAEVHDQFAKLIFDADDSIIITNQDG